MPDIAKPPREKVEPTFLRIVGGDAVTSVFGRTGDVIGEPLDYYATDHWMLNTSRLLGRTTVDSGPTEEITVGSGLLLSAGTLSATGGGGGGGDWDYGLITEASSSNQDWGGLV